MADEFLTESAEWVEAIYQLKTTDPVLGGPDGIDNRAPRELANRTLWLKTQILAAADDLAAHAAGRDHPAATEALLGLIRLSTMAEALAGTDASTAMSPAMVKAAVDSAVTALVDSSPATLDTLAELAAALGNDDDFAATITAALAAKAPLASPAFTGTPTVPTAAPGTNTTQAASTAFVVDAVADISLDAYARLDSPQTFTKSQGCANVTLTDAATITPDFSASNNLAVVLGGNRILGLPTGIVAGKGYRLDIRQDTIGGRALALAWCYQTTGGVGITLSTGALARDKLFLDVAVYATAAVAITIATPGLVTWTGHGLTTGQRVQLTTTGALPTGLTPNTSYYVIVNDADSFWLAASLAAAAAGTKIATSGSQSGIHTMTACTIDVAIKKGFE